MVSPARLTRSLLSRIKNGSHFTEVRYAWIWHSNISLSFSALSAEDKLYLEKKTPQSKGRKITLVSDNKISEVWAYLFQNLAKWDERNIKRPKFTTGHSILFTNGHCDHPLWNPYFKRWFCETVLEYSNAILECKRESSFVMNKSSFVKWSRIHKKRIRHLWKLSTALSATYFPKTWHFL